MARRESTDADKQAGLRLSRRTHLLAARFREDCSGATAIEYGLIAALTFLAFVGALRLYGDRMTVMYEYIGTTIGKASS